jgi:hypothetical protein
VERVWAFGGASRSDTDAFGHLPLFISARFFTCELGWMLHGLSCLTKRPCIIYSPFRRSCSRFNNRLTMNWSANVLSAATSDTEPTIIIEFDRAKYIFNVGENTNRAFCQNRPNWKKTKSFFLTSLGTQRASGLPGEYLMITIMDPS